MKELQLRMRGLVEEEEEDVRDRVTNILSLFLGKTQEEVDRGLDLVYRLRSKQAERQGFSQDIIINCVSRRWKGEILRQSYDNPMECKGEKVVIMRELPWQVLPWKTFKGLIEKLKKKNVRFRWELLLRLSFAYNGERVLIKTDDQMKKILSDNAKDFVE